jgi:polyhydroxybutyrate depolymerase
VVAVWLVASVLATAVPVLGENGSPAPRHAPGTLRAPEALRAPADARSSIDAAGSTFEPSAVDAACQPTLQVGSQTLGFDVDGTPREVIIHVPASGDGRRLPAVVAFHGFSALASQLEVTSGLSALADEGPFVVAYPQALDRPPEWHVAGSRDTNGRDLDMIRSLLKVLVEQACADPGRIILAGHSMGGAMASDAACRLADQVAGVVLVSALWFELPCQPARPVPVVATHALDDPVLPYEGGLIGGIASGIPEQLPVESAIGAWAAHDGCGSTPAESTADDGAIVTWPGCTTPVVLHRLATGGHGWPAMASHLIAEMAASG